MPYKEQKHCNDDTDYTVSIISSDWTLNNVGHIYDLYSCLVSLWNLSAFIKANIFLSSLSEVCLHSWMAKWGEEFFSSNV